MADENLQTAQTAAGLGSLLVPGLGLAQLGLGLYGALSAKKSAKKARRKQKKLIAAQLGELNKLAAQYQPGGGAYQGAKAGLAAKQERDISEILAQQSRSFVKTTTSGNVREQYRTRTGRGQDMALEDWLNEKYASIQREKANILGSIDVRGPSASSVQSAWSNVGQGLGTLAQWGFGRMDADGKNMGSDITPMPEPTVPLGPRVEPLHPAIETYMQGVLSGGLKKRGK